METNMVERLFQDDMKWDLNSAEDMCEKESPELERMAADYSHYDENSWEELDPKQVLKGEQEEYERFCKMGVYEYVNRAEAENDDNGKFVKVKWVRVKKGEGVRCRLVAQELGYGERLDELFAGTPSLGSVRMALTHAMKNLITTSWLIHRRLYKLIHLWGWGVPNRRLLGILGVPNRRLLGILCFWLFCVFSYIEMFAA